MAILLMIVIIARAQIQSPVKFSSQLKFSQQRLPRDGMSIQRG